MSNKVTWGRSVSSYTNSVAEEFKRDLKSVAEAMANHDRVDTVSNKHVDEAFAALARSGLNCKPLYRRSDFWTGIGGLCAGLSFSIPDGFNSVADYFDAQWITKLSFPTLFVVFSLGVAVYFWSVFSNTVWRR